MAESRKMKTEKGLALVPGANPLADGCNFAVEVPEDSRASLILYKKRSAKPYVEIPFTGGLSRVRKCSSKSCLGLSDTFFFRVCKSVVKGEGIAAYFGPE